MKRIRYPLKDLPLHDETYKFLSQAVAPIMKKKSYDQGIQYTLYIRTGAAKQT